MVNGWGMKGVIGPLRTRVSFVLLALLLWETWVPSLSLLCGCRFYRISPH